MKNKPIHDNTETGLNELDRLVTQEIDALQHQSRKTTRVKKTQKRQSKQEDNVIFQEGWQKPKPNYKNKPHPQEPVFPDHSENFPDEPEHGLISEENQHVNPASDTELFTEEELEFVERSTAWLESRENKDLIISRIWEQLTETVPESFYSVKPEDHPQTEDAFENPYTEAPYIEGHTEETDPGEDNPEIDPPGSSS